MRLLVAAVLLSTTSAALADDERDAVYAVARQVIAGFDGRDTGTVRGATWPDGYHSITRRDWGTETLTRHWHDVANHGLGVNYQTRLGRPSISIDGDRARIDVRYSYRVYNFSDATPSECGNGTYRFDLRRRQAEWRVLDMTDVVFRSSTRCR
jgi:hypothetical protein